MGLLKKLLIFIIIFIFPLGEVARIDFGNGIASTALDVGVFLIVAVWVIKIIVYKIHLKFTFKVPILLFLGVCVISLILNIFSYTFFQFFISSLYLIRYFMYLCLFFVVKDFSKRDKNHIEKAILVGGGLVLLFGFLQFFLYPSLRNLIYEGWDQHLYRMFSTFLDPNFAGVFFVLYFIYLLSKTLDSLKLKRKKLIIPFVLLCLFSILAIFLSYSRSAYIMLGIGIITLISVTRIKKNVLKITIGLGIVGFLVAILLYKPSEGTNLFRTVSTSARVGDMQNAVNIFLKSPIYGIGFNSYRYAQKKIGVFSPLDETWDVGHGNAGADNSFLFVLATTGLVGFFAFIYMWYSIISKTIYKTRFGNIHGKLLLSSIISLFFGSIFINSLFFPLILFWLWIVMGLMDYT